jgi:hypothetical protein
VLHTDATVRILPIYLSPATIEMNPSFAFTKSLLAGAGIGLVAANVFIVGLNFSSVAQERINIQLDKLRPTKKD